MQNPCEMQYCVSERVKTRRNTYFRAVFFDTHFRSLGHQTSICSAVERRAAREPHQTLAFAVLCGAPGRARRGGDVAKGQLHLGGPGDAGAHAADIVHEP